jgi:hypothetical protein
VVARGAQNFLANAIGTEKTPRARRRRKWQLNCNFFWLFGWYGHHILVWPIAALRNELSANQKRVFSVTRRAETGFMHYGHSVYDLRFRVQNAKIQGLEGRLRV